MNAPIKPATVIELSDNINTHRFPAWNMPASYFRYVGDGIVYAPPYNHPVVKNNGFQPGHNLFLATLDTCFSNHFPITISPDILWMLVVQGAAHHIKLTQEESRDLLVKHQGKKKIEVRNDELLSDPSQWENIPFEFIDAFRKDLTDPTIVEVLKPRFSTTTPVDSTAFAIGVMDVFSSYLEYITTTLCGIPEVHLEGNTDDWQLFKSNLERLESIGLGWWVKSLYPLLDNIILASSGHKDVDFWESMYKLNSISGGPYINGWIIKFYPYLILDWKLPIEVQKNPYLDMDAPPMKLTINNFYNGISKVDFVWSVLDVSKNMSLVSGFVGLSQNENNPSLKPIIGWCVMEGKA